MGKISIVILMGEISIVEHCGLAVTASSLWSQELL